MVVSEGDGSWSKAAKRGSGRCGTPVLPESIGSVIRRQLPPASVLKKTPESRCCSFHWDTSGLEAPQDRPKSYTAPSMDRRDTPVPVDRSTLALSFAGIQYFWANPAKAHGLSPCVAMRRRMQAFVGFEAKNLAVSGPEFV